MTVEQIDAQITKLKEQKKQKQQQEKARLQRKKVLENQRKRKLENRVKYILGGWVLAQNDKEKIFENFSDGMRNQDLKTLKDYFGL